MKDKEFNIKFGPIKSPIFREKTEGKIEIPLLSFSEEKDNDIGLGSKRIDLLVEGTKEEVGTIYFDYPKEGIEKLLRVRTIAVAKKYRGHNLSVKLYEHLLSLAREKGLEGVSSDNTVQAGAVLIPKKLKEKGYDVSLNPKVQDKYNEFMKKYKDGKYFEETLRVPDEESVFEVHLKEK